MKNVYKIFMVTNLVLSLVFVGVMATLLAQKADYRKKYESEVSDRAREKSDLDAKIQGLDSTISQKTTELEGAVKARDLLKQDYDQVLIQKGDLENKYTSLDASYKSISQSLNSLEAKLEEKEKRLLQFGEEIKQREQELSAARVSMEKALDTQHLAEKELADAKLAMTDLEKRHEDAKKDKEQLEQVVESLKRAGVDVEGLIVQEPPIDGKVIAVSKNVNLVMLDVGEDDKVKKGYHFTIFRGDKYVGKVVIEEVYKDMAAARGLVQYQKENEQIKEGDNASTRILSGGG